MKYYYVNREDKIIYVYEEENINNLEYLGCSENLNIKLVCSAFLKDQTGYTIIEE